LAQGREGAPVQPLPELQPPTPWVLVAGGEGSGIRPLVARTADFRASIPMWGEVESLNVANACAVALFSLCRLGTAKAQEN